jgi:uncharacterized membrane protein YbaN (DUF454 family)
MYSPKRHVPLSFPRKLIYLLLAFLFLLLGIVGILLPIIPGLLFLFLAALLIVRISRRASEMAHGHRGFSRLLRHWNAATRLPVVEQIKLSMLYVARSLLSGIRSVCDYWRRNIAR